MAKRDDIPTVYYNQRDSDKEEIKHRWWNSDEKEMHAHAFGVFKKIKANQNSRIENNSRFARLYLNTAMDSFFRQSRATDLRLPNMVTYNIVKACIDTATSKIAAEKPRPLFLTESGSWELQQRAKALTNYMQGLFMSMGTGFGPDRSLYSVGRECFSDAAIFGTGATRFFAEKDIKDKTGTIKAERDVIDEVIVDEIEGIYRKPRQIFRMKRVARDVLMDMFPKHAEKIKSAPNSFEKIEHLRSDIDMVDLLQGWHLPSGKNATDGRLFVGIENCTLDVDDHKKQYFPYLFQRWSLRPLGFYGAGIAEELIGLQLEINKTLRAIQIAHHLFVPQVWLNTQSKTVTKKINNEIGGIKYYAGAQPVFATPQAVHEATYRHLENLYAKGFEIVGISQLSSTSKKPSGLDAAVALREYQDIESERFAIVSQAYEDYYIDAAYIVLDQLRDLRKDGIDVEVRIKDGDLMKRLRFSDVDIPDDKITVRPYPTNFLPKTPSGKLQKVQELVQAGIYSQEEAHELLDYPDLAKVNKIKLSPRNYIIQTIEEIIKTGKFISPEPYMRLDQAISIAQAYYALGRTEGMPEKKLQLLRDFMEKADLLRRKGMPNPAAMPQQPLASPEPPPTSELVPNVPVPA